MICPMLSLYWDIFLLPNILKNTREAKTTYCIIPLKWDTKKAKLIYIIRGQNRALEGWLIMEENVEEAFRALVMICFLIWLLITGCI